MKPNGSYKDEKKKVIWTNHVARKVEKNHTQRYEVNENEILWVLAWLQSFMDQQTKSEAYNK